MFYTDLQQERGSWVSVTDIRVLLDTSLQEAQLHDVECFVS